MNGKDILQGMSFISDELVQEADSQPIRKRNPWKKWLPLAACLCLILGGAFSILLPGMGEVMRETGAAGSQDSCLILDQELANGAPEHSMENSLSGVQSQDGAAALTDFGIRLLQITHTGESNTLLSPLSVAYALGMTANGAKGDTLFQMEAAMGISAPALNEWIRDYTDSLPQSDGGRLLSANAIWYRSNGLTVNDSFRQVNSAYYRADIRAAAFDQDTLLEINTWVNDNTKGMIPQILDEISPEAVMYLINALTFEAEWETVYREDQVYRDIFTTEGSKEQTVDFLHSQERHYLENDLSTGFIKYYKDGNYAFAALLPKEDVTVQKLIDSLSGESLRDLLASPTEVTVYASIPKFKAEFSVELSDSLKAMGMELPFDEIQADFSGMGDPGNGTTVYLSKVIHKTYLQLDEQGTRAGAATAVTAFANGALMDVKHVDLDRPFVYMLIDCQSGLPFFIGCMMDTGS